jgi:AraC-like DNA-binding protein
MAYTHHTIAINQVDQILHGARRRGLDIASLLQRAAIPPQLLGVPMARVSHAQYMALLHILRRVTRDELWGLSSVPLRPGSFALACRILIRCVTLAHAFKSGFSFFRVMLPDFRPHLDVQNGVARVYLHTRAVRDARVNYLERTFIFFAFGLACWLAGRRIPVIDVTYTDDALSPTADSMRLFEAPIFYRQPCMGFRFEARWLNLPVARSEQEMNEFLRQAPASLLIKFRDASNVTEKLRRLLRQHVAGDFPSMNQAAEALGLSPQALGRRLRDEGQGYQAIKDDLRRDVAIEYLMQTNLTLLDVAAMVGFSEPSTFHRAFKKWTGVAPGEYRQLYLRQQG